MSVLFKPGLLAGGSFQLLFPPAVMHGEIESRTTGDRKRGIRESEREDGRVGQEK